MLTTLRSRAVLVACALATGRLTCADTICVPADYPTIQEAIGAAVDGDEICVGPGTYPEMIDLDGKAVRLYSTDGPMSTIIDSQGDGPVVRCDSEEGADTIIEGFTITGAMLGFGALGGGMLIDGSNPTVIRCRFVGNRTGNGGGIVIFGNPALLTIRECAFIDNLALDDGGAIGAGTAGRPVGDVLLEDCAFLRNRVTDATFQSGGAGLLVATTAEGTVFTVRRCHFSGNRCVRGTRRFGGAILAILNANIVVEDCSISCNRAPDGGGGIHVLDQATVSVTRSAFCENYPDNINAASGYVDGGGNEFCPRACLADLDDDRQVTFGDVLVVLTDWGPCGE